MSLGIDKAALFDLFRYKPHPGQLAVHRSNARYRVMACGVRFGKSTCAAMETACEMLAPRGVSVIWVVAPTYELTQRITTQVRIAFLQHLPHRVLDDDTRSQRFVVQNLGGGTSEMRGKSTDNSAGLLGEGVDFLVLDEAAKAKQEVWESYLAPRLVDRKGRALLISTPRGTDWFYKEFRRGQKDRHPEYESWRAPTTDNPAIDPEVVEAERRKLSKEAFAQEYLAKFLGEELEQCELCSNPSDTITRELRYADLASEPRCTLCNGIVDLRGVTRVHRGDVGRPTLCADAGPGLRSRLQPGEDFETEVANLRARIDHGLQPRRSDPTL